MPIWVVSTHVGAELPIAGVIESFANDNLRICAEFPHKNQESFAEINGLTDAAELASFRRAPQGLDDRSKTFLACHF